MNVATFATLLALLVQFASADEPIRAPDVRNRPREERIADATTRYREETVTFGNSAAPGVTLSGTMTLPRAEGQFPALIFWSDAPAAGDVQRASHRVAAFKIFSGHQTPRD